MVCGPVFQRRKGSAEWVYIFNLPFRGCICPKKIV